MTPLLSSALLATQSDARLLALARAGHDRAFEAIVERYRRPLGRYLRRVLSAPLAEDVLQATFVNAWRSLERGTDVRDLRPWLYRIAHNQAVNALSRAEPRVAAEAAVDELVATAPGPEAEAEQRDTLQRTLTAIAGLPDRQRAALVAVAVEDRPHLDVAHELGLSEGALRQLVHRARTTLRAAATAVVPVPLVSAAVAGGSDTPLARVAEVAAGAGGVGLGVKTGAALLATGAMVVGAPAVHEQRTHRGVARVAAAHAAPARPVPRAAPVHRRVVVRAVAPRPRVAARPAPAVHATVPVRRVRPRPVLGGSAKTDDHGGRDEHATSGSDDAPAPVTTSAHGDDGGRSGGSGSTQQRITEPIESHESGGGSSSSSGPGPGSGSGPVSSSGSGSGSGDAAAMTADSSDGSGHGSGDDAPALP